MYIRKSTRTYKDKTYTNYLLVESRQTSKGPRQRIICSLGSLEPGPAEEWLGLAHKLQSALQGQESLPKSSQQMQDWVEKARRKYKGPAPADDGNRSGSSITVDAGKIEIEEAREAGPVHVGHQLWGQLGINRILQEAGLSQRACMLTEVMTLNRLICPLSEHAMPDWIRRTALADILKEDFSKLQDEALYRNLDRLHPNREPIERALAEKEKTLFNLDDTVYLYDLTSTYFEGQAKANPQAKRGYSRDKRPDCKQVVVGLVLDRDGFPKAHEIFDGNMQDRRSLDRMLDVLEKRTGKRPGATVIVDRGLAFDENLEQIRKRGLHYLVAGLQPERNQWLDELENDDGWENIVRLPSPRNPFQKKPRVEIKRQQKDGVVYILCRSDGRKEKDRAIRETQEAELLVDLHKLQLRVAKGRLKEENKIQRAIGRLQERYPRVARYYEITCDAIHSNLSWKELGDKKTIAKKLDGSYVLKTDRQDLTADEIWRTYILLTRVEDAFRDFKGPLMERPIFHQLQDRTQTHIFLCVLAYHLLAAIEHRFLQAGVHTSWWTIRQQLSTHQVVTIVLPTDEHGRILKIRKATTPEPEHRRIYATLHIPADVLKPSQAWRQNECSDEKNLKL
jgi:transposase